jgi:hypothetical protein
MTANGGADSAAKYFVQSKPGVSARSSASGVGCIAAADRAARRVERRLGQRRFDGDHGAGAVGRLVGRCAQQQQHLPHLGPVLVAKGEGPLACQATDVTRSSKSYPYVIPTPFGRAIVFRRPVDV